MLRNKGKKLPTHITGIQQNLKFEVSQNKFFPETIKRLEQGKKLYNKDVLLAFSPFMDDNTLKARGQFFYAILAKPI